MAKDKNKPGAPDAGPALADDVAPATAEATPKAIVGYRVSLQGVPCRVVDKEGRPQYLDHLDVIPASNEGEAWMKFKEHNGILSTQHQPKFSPLYA